ncbi:MAG TPA: 6-phosphogluconolactonase [Anaerolineales bacterium]|nr:6-phosphogluconolactonase [Anaerolineales bacterium]
MERLHFDHPEKLFSDMAAELEAIATAAIAERGVFQLVLNGGSTPSGLFEVLRSGAYRGSDAWRATQFWWGDERSVRPGAGGSNYRMAREQLLDPLEIEPSQVRRIKGELDSVEAAVHYTELLRRAAGPGRGWPCFDLVLLGLGLDGHTASLFPGSVEPEGAAAIAVTAHYGDRPSERVSLSSAVFNSARNVFFMVVGEEKKEIVERVLDGPYEPELLPAQRIRPLAGEVAWWLNFQK